LATIESIYRKFVCAAIMSVVASSKREAALEEHVLKILDYSGGFQRHDFPEHLQKDWKRIENTRIKKEAGNSLSKRQAKIVLQSFLRIADEIGSLLDKPTSIESRRPLRQKSAKKRRA
jgi:hypothetical protein